MRTLEELFLPLIAGISVNLLRRCARNPAPKRRCCSARAAVQPLTHKSTTFRRLHVKTLAQPVISKCSMQEQYTKTDPIRKPAASCTVAVQDAAGLRIGSVFVEALLCRSFLAASFRSSSTSIAVIPRTRVLMTCWTLSKLFTGMLNEGIGAAAGKFMKSVHSQEHPSFM